MHWILLKKCTNVTFNQILSGDNCVSTKHYIIVIFSFLQTENIVQKITQLKWRSYQKWRYQNMWWAGQISPKWICLKEIDVFCKIKLHWANKNWVMRFSENATLCIALTASSLSIMLQMFKYNFITPGRLGVFFWFVKKQNKRQHQSILF